MALAQRRVLLAAALALVIVGAGATVVVLATSNRAGHPAASSRPTVTPKRSAPATSPPTTTVRQYDPWVAGEPAAGLRLVTAAGDANCWEGSIDSARSDAYRCSTPATYGGGNLFDPCFASPTDVHRLLCPSEPLSAHRVVALTSAHPGLPNAPATADSGEPWDIELLDGATCHDISGATVTVGGVPANYSCSDHRVLWGEPNRSTPTWTIRSSTSYQATHFTSTAVVAVWF